VRYVDVTDDALKLVEDALTLELILLSDYLPYTFKFFTLFDVFVRSEST